MSFPTSPTNGQQATVNGIVYNYNSTKGAWIKNVTTAGTLTSGNLVLTSNTASIGINNGALVVTGGVGVSGNIIVANVLIPAITTTSANLLYTMGVRRTGYNRSSNGFSNWEYGTIASGNDPWGSSGNAWSIDSAQGAGLLNLVAGAYHDSLTNPSPSSTTYKYFGTRGASRINLADNAIIFYQGNLPITGGQVAGDIVNFTETVRFAASTGNVVINSNTTSTSTTTGALVVSGGIGVAGNIYSGGNLTLSTASTNILNSSGRPILQQSGSVLQVVQATDNAYRSASVSAGSETDWVSATITRVSTASKILCIFSGAFASSEVTDVAVRLNSSLDGRQGEGANSAITQSIMSPGTDKGGSSALGGTGDYMMFNSHFTHLYTPSNSTATITMTVRIWSEGVQTLYPNGDGWRGGGAQSHSIGSHLILMEIAT